MAADIVFLETDDRGIVQEGWQLARAPSRVDAGGAGAATVNATMTAAKLATDIHEVQSALVVGDERAIEVFDVSAFQSIAVQAWGEAADTNTFTLELYGWAANGPGHHVQQMAACVFGNFTSAASTGWHASVNTHSSIRKVFAAATAYRGADTYLLTAAKDFSVKKDLVSPAVQIQTNAEADFPAEFIVDFATNRYKYFAVAVTATTGTSVGAIWKPLSYRARV